MASHDGVSLVVLLLSSIHCCLAPSIIRKLFTQAFEADVLQARINAGSTTATTMITNTTVAAATINFLELRVMTLNAAAQARPARDVQDGVEVQSRRYLEQPGSAISLW